MPVWQKAPTLQVTITHAAVNYFVDATDTIVRRRENGFDIATLQLPDTNADIYANKSANDDVITIEEKDSTDAGYTTIFSGVIRERHPAISMEGNMIRLECDGAGYGLGVTVCGDEYGKESRNFGDDTIREVAIDILDHWVNEIFDSGTGSGYTYTNDIEAIAGDIRYIAFPYKWNYKAINDVCDYVQAIKGAAAGPHWIVSTDKNFLLTTVGAHAAPALAHWPTWWRTDEPGSTLAEGVDFIRSNFEELSKEANYILYGGVWRRPGCGDPCENTSGQWDTAGAPAPSLDDDWVVHKVGLYSLQTWCAGGAGGIGRIWWPHAEDMSLNLLNVGKAGNPPYMHFYALKDNVVNAIEAWMVTNAATNKYFYHDFTADLVAADTWYHFSYPIGPYYNTTDETKSFLWGEGAGGGDWTNINSMCFYFGLNDGEYLNFDAVHMTGGPILRGARPAAAYTAANPMKIKVVTDDVGKDDSLKATDDTGTLARMAYAELLRCQSTPIIGTFTTPIAPDALPGQLVHPHAKKKADGSFAIDKATHFRITELIHHIYANGATTTWTVTDDVTNAIARSASSDLNKVLSNMRPEYQDRQASSIKGSILDINVPILEHTY